MQPSIMITNGGPHPTDKWAQVTAAAILALIEIDDNSDSAEAKLARKQKRELEFKLPDILEPHHDAVQVGERSAIGHHGHARLSHSINPAADFGDTLSKVQADVIAAAKGTMFEAHFAKPEVQAFIHNLIGQHFGSLMDVERAWHADRNASAPEAQAYRKARGARHGRPA